MAFDLANPTGTGSDQELLDFTRAAIAEITLYGKTITQRGKTLDRQDLPALHRQEDRYEARINAAAGGSTVNIARRNRPL
jgi:hypothetical protein